MVGTQNDKETEVIQEGGAGFFRAASSVSRCYDYGTMCNRPNESCPSTRGKVFLKFLVALGAGGLFALAGCGEKPKPAENVAANVGAREFTEFSTKYLPAQRDAVAPDGSDVRLLLRLKGGSMIHFELAPNRTSKAVTHRTVEEIWYFVSGRGQVWRKQNGQATVVDVYPGVSLTIPLGTQFQFRSFGHEPLAAIGVTMPPWPGDDEAIIVRGEWEPTQP
jgi:mannose-6-phosphate isomerase-like protein (cupin superfamily)